MSSIGVISDTHGLVRPEAVTALQGRCAHRSRRRHRQTGVLEALRTIAPVTAVRGNNDHGPWAEEIEETAAVQIGGVWLYVLHDLHELDLDPKAAGFAAVIAGHSHRPKSKSAMASCTSILAAPARDASRCRLRWRGWRLHGDRVQGEIVTLGSMECGVQRRFGWYARKRRLARRTPIVSASSAMASR
jgi:hypothetical protein